MIDKKTQDALDTLIEKRTTEQEALVEKHYDKKAKGEASSGKKPIYVPLKTPVLNIILKDD